MLYPPWPGVSGRCGSTSAGVLDLKGIQRERHQRVVADENRELRDAASPDALERGREHFVGDEMLVQQFARVVVNGALVRGLERGAFRGGVWNRSYRWRDRPRGRGSRESTTRVCESQNRAVTRNRKLAETPLEARLVASELSKSLSPLGKFRAVKPGAKRPVEAPPGR